MNIFERASRANLTLSTARGELPFSELWKLPLSSRDGFNLDEVAKTASRNLKALAEESFVATNRSPATSTAELRLEIVKYVIESKLSDKSAAETRAKNAEQQQRITEALRAKETEELANMSKADLLKALEDLKS